MRDVIISFPGYRFALCDPWATVCDRNQTCDFPESDYADFAFDSAIISARYLKSQQSHSKHLHDSLSGAGARPGLTLYGWVPNNRCHLIRHDPCANSWGPLRMRKGGFGQTENWLAKYSCDYDAGGRALLVLEELTQRGRAPCQALVCREAGAWSSGSGRCSLRVLLSSLRLRTIAVKPLSRSMDRHAG